MQAVSDEQLIQWVANGDASCLGTLFERHHRGVYQFCLQMTRNPGHAEDIVQEVFIKVLKAAKKFRGEGTFKGWMYNIARNATYDYMRQNKRHGDPAEPGEYVDSLNVDELSAEHAAEGRQRMGILVQALASLPAQFQEIIWLGRFQFDSFKDLSQALNCKEGTARVRMHRAMQQLNLAFAEINGAPFDE
ncbi:MAG: sigma-70 family RNA polymerase sigma factor [Xanthomonadales bacterium]|nr:sigma-70 family RNA polymerase sigma factor [Xanthomonadales bacterium]